MKNLHKQKKTIIYGVALLAIVSFSFLTYNFIAKGATYGWLQASWSGGADTGAVANHTSNQSGWTKFFSKDDNISTADDQLTLSAGTSNVTDTTTTQFDAGTNTSGTTLPVTHSGDELKLNLGYNASGICGNFYVLPLDRGGATPTAANWTTAISYCDSLCPTCDLPTLTEFACMCTNKASFGNNFVADNYWSATEYYGTYAYFVLFSSCAANYYAKTNALYVRCVRR